MQAKRYPKFANFGEYLFWSYANLQMLCAALNMGKAKYDKSCYMIRAKAFKAYKEATEGRGKASECVHCGQCEGACPQHLPLTDQLKRAAQMFPAED